jgi:hypothetical protein
MKKVLLIFAVICISTVFAAFLIFSRLSYKPAWYRAGQTVSKDIKENDSEKIPSVSPSIEAIEKVAAQEGKAVIEKKSSGEIMMKMAERQTNMEGENVVKAVNTKTENENLEIEAVVDIASIPRDKLPSRAARALDRLLAVIPGNSLEELYIKFEVSGLEEGSRMVIDPQSKVYIGKMAFKVKDLEKRTGLSAQRVIDKIGWSRFEAANGHVVLKALNKQGVP